MAASMNKVFLMGNLTRDPELRYIPSGAAVASFSIAVNRVYKDNAGEKKEEVTFIGVVVWGKMAEVCGEYLTKGRPVMVEGRLKSSSWEAPDGQKRSKLEVVATNVQFLGSRQQKEAAPQGAAPQGAAPQEAKPQSSGMDAVDSIDVDQDMGGGDVPF